MVLLMYKNYIDIILCCTIDGGFVNCSHQNYFMFTNPYAAILMGNHGTDTI